VGLARTICLAPDRDVAFFWRIRRHPETAFDALSLAEIAGQVMV